MPMAADLRNRPTPLADQPPRGRLLADLADRLTPLGFWDQPAFQGSTNDTRLAFLSDLVDPKQRPARGAPPTTEALADHPVNVTADVRALMCQWRDEYQEVLNEDLSRILLGELVPRPAEAVAATAGLERFLGQTRLLVEELVQLTRRLEWNADLERALVCERPLPADARRICEIARALEDLFDSRRDA